MGVTESVLTGREMVAFFWLMTLLPLEFQQPDGRLSLMWTMVYALAAVLLTAIFYGMKRLLCRRSGGREA